MPEAITFTEEQITGLFGELAAEDEEKSRFKSSFFKSATYEKIHNDRPLRILVAHKGIGKSALFRMSYEENIEHSVLSLWIKPNDIADLCKVDENENSLGLIEKWKVGLNQRIVELVLKEFQINTDTPWIQNVVKNGVKLIDSVTEIVKILKDKADIGKTKELVVKKYLSKHRIVIYIDDLDRAWEGTSNNIKRIAALLNAVRDLTNESEGLSFRISLRSDVYFLVRTADESTDKIEGNVIWLTWTEHELLVFLAKRVQSYLGYSISESSLLKKPQFEIAKCLYPIMECNFMGEGKWKNRPIYYILLSLTRRRPRDLINLCTQAAREANDNHHMKIDTGDWESIFSRYSQNRLQDTINEHRYELPDIRRLLLGMKPSHDQKKLSGSHKYTEKQLLNKISGIMQTGDFLFADGHKATSNELLAFMYKINFLVARKDLADGYIDRKYFEDNNYLSSECVEFGYDWEVHPAFRWALYPESKDIFANIDIPALL